MRLIQKPSIVEISNMGLATGSTAITWHPIFPVFQRFFEQGATNPAILKLSNYAIILVAVIIEGPLATLLGGVWASMGRVNFLGVLAVSALAGILADSFWYYVGRYGKETVLNRWRRFFKVDQEAINHMESVLFGENKHRVLFMAKLTSALIIPALVAAGLTGMTWRSVMRVLLPAQLIWSVGLTALGFIAADSYIQISQKVENFGLYVGIGVGAIAIGYGLYRWRKAQESNLISP